MDSILNGKKIAEKIDTVQEQMRTTCPRVEQQLNDSKFNRFGTHDDDEQDTDPMPEFKPGGQLIH